jgi:hypothetical protein
MKNSRLLTALLALLPALACGKRGDPRPPLRKNPQPIASFRIAQRADRLEISGVAPRLSTEGAALKPFTVEILSAESEGDFMKIARKRSFVVQPGEAFNEPETLPAPGTLLRVAAHALASGKPSAMTSLLSLPVQAPPAPPFELVGALSEGGVQLKWSGKRPNPLPPPPSPVTPPSPATAAPPSGTPSTGAPPVGTPAAPPAAPTPPTSAGAPPPPSGTPTSPTPAGPDGQRGRPSHPGAPATAPAGPVPAPVGPPGKSGFWVYRRAKAGRYDRPLFAEPTGDKSYLDPDAAAGQDWCYVVRAVVSHEPVIESASSNEVCVAARDIAPPAAPSGLTLRVAPGALELRWSPSPEPDLAFYRVYRATPTGSPAKIAEVPAGTAVYLDATTTAGTAYRYTITAVDQAGNESLPSAPLLGNSP